MGPSAAAHAAGMTRTIATITPLRDCGLRPAVVVGPDATVLDGARRMREANVSSLLVGEPGCLVSIVTERDIVAAMADGMTPDERITAISADNPYTVAADTTLAAAGHRMIELGVRHLVVAEGDRALGVVAMRDVVAVLLSGTEGPDVTLTLLCGSIAEHPELWLG